MNRANSICHQLCHDPFPQVQLNACAGSIVQIGNTRVPKNMPDFDSLNLIPTNVSEEFDENSEFLAHLQWLLQKLSLNQDIFLIGPPGPLRRHLVRRVCSLLDLPVEYICLTRDTTESDLKQRRELRNGDLLFQDECVVRAVLNGRVLILDGIEKAERNVLPVINNLLENRELVLEDGRTIIHWERYDKLEASVGSTELTLKGILRASEQFLVISLGLPVSLYGGIGLDPPLRSRFQARAVEPIHSRKNGWSLVTDMKHDLPANIIERALDLAAKLGVDPLSLLPLIHNCTVTQPLPIIRFDSGTARLVSKNSHVSLITGPSTSKVHSEFYSKSLNSLLLGHAIGDICIVGDRGVGKSTLAKHFAEVLGYHVELVPMHRDLVARDLVLERHAGQGDSSWMFSSIVQGMVSGALVILDGLEQLQPGVLSSIQQVFHDRELYLPDNRRIVTPAAFNRILERTKLTEQELNDSGCYQTHPAFRIIGLARPMCPDARKKNWISEEIGTLFTFVHMSIPTMYEQDKILSDLGMLSKPVQQLLSFIDILRSSKDDTVLSLATCFSTRRVVSLSRRLAQYPNDSISELVRQTCLYSFLPVIVRNILDELLLNYGFLDAEVVSREPITLEKNKRVVSIGGITVQLGQVKNELLIPQTVFYHNTQQLTVMRDMIRDFQLGAHLLLIGNQGVGKNKIVDYMLQTLELSCEYIQLHRDSSIQSLISQTSVEKGELIHGDSALIRALVNGYVLVIDEADKAPVHVTVVIKMLSDLSIFDVPLPDGRRVTVDSTRGLRSNYIPVHPDFRLIVLANRPGFPFLGNDFYREIGDMFSVHTVANPDPSSELTLLKRYGPSIPTPNLIRIQEVFNDLREMYDSGKLTYPYSTREIVNVVRHLEQYPGDRNVFQNVFDFDQYDVETKEIICEVLERHGVAGYDMRDKYHISVAGKNELPVPRVVATLSRVSIEMPESILRENPLPLSFTQGQSPIVSHCQMHCYDSRSGDSFTETKFTFEFPQKSILSVVTWNSIVFGISAEPIILYIVDRGFQSYTSIDLDGYYSYSPSDVPRIQLYVFGEDSPTIVVHHADENFLLLVQNLTIRILRLPEPSSSAFFASRLVPLTNFSFIVFWPRRSTACLIDLKQSSQTFLTFPFNLWHIFFLSIGSCLVYSCSSTFDPYTTDLISVSRLTITPNGSEISSRITGISERVSNHRYLFGFEDHSLATVMDEFSGKTKSNIYEYPRISSVPMRNSVSISLPQSLHCLAFSDFSGRAFLELCDFTLNTFHTIDISDPNGMQIHGHFLCPLDEYLLCVGSNGFARVIQIDREALQKDYAKWRQDLENAIAPENLSIEISNEDGLEGSGDGQGSGDGTGSGEGSGDGDGEGSGEPRELEVELGRSLEKEYALEDIEGVSIEIRNDSKPATRSERSVSIPGADSRDLEMYSRFVEATHREVHILKQLLESREMVREERQWISGQTSGELDQRRIADALAGEPRVFRRRAEVAPEDAWALLPKRMSFLFDLSASMSRFNSHDGRLDRSLEMAVLVMESFSSFPNKYQYRILGHSGEEVSVPFVNEESPAIRRRMEVVKEMGHHSAHCARGDSTVDALTAEVDYLASKAAESDETILVLLSDANFGVYGANGINELREALDNASSVGVNCFIVFVGTLRDQATSIMEKLPHNRAFVCLDTKEIPTIFSMIFAAII